MIIAELLFAKEALVAVSWRSLTRPLSTQCGIDDFPDLQGAVIAGVEQPYEDLAQSIGVEEGVSQVITAQEFAACPADEVSSHSAEMTSCARLERCFPSRRGPASLENSPSSLCGKDQGGKREADEQETERGGENRCRHDQSQHPMTETPQFLQDS